MPVLAQRVLSALAALAIFFASFYFGGYLGLSILATVIISIGVIEFGLLGNNIWAEYKNVIYTFCSISIGLHILHVALGKSLPIAHIFGPGLVAYFFVSLWVTRMKTNNRSILKVIGFYTLGFIYAVLLPSFAVRLMLEESFDRLILLLIIVFAGDTFAYFGGRFMGKRPLASHLSPKKTLEGAMFGLIGSILLALIVNLQLKLPIENFKLVLFSVATGLAAQTGDLFESLIKRVAGKKDSGYILPGHGGVLDRLDGVYFAAPIFYILVTHF